MGFLKKFSIFLHDAEWIHIFISFTKTNNRAIISRK